jgi:transglutaminase-like putative cysteine protease
MRWLSPLYERKERNSAMPLLTVRHITVYRYSEPVTFGEHRMMFRPRESHDLRLLESSLEITPHPSRLRWLHDAFDNSVAVATFAARTTELRFDSSVTLEHLETAPPEYPLEESAKTYPFFYSAEELRDLARARINQHPSERLSAWARQFIEPLGSTGTMDLLRSMTQKIRHEFRYVRRTEKGVQSPGETLENGCGSCRDFAVLMIEATRSLGLAARFVSGYIFVPDLDSGKTKGAGSTHAWMQAYLPGAGWIDFDPTNSIVGNRNLIRVAVAWDQGQALPLWGTYSGSASSFIGMDVSVSVTLDGSRGV